MYPDLRGKKAVVTGAAGGIGAATSRALAAAGASVAAWDLDADGAEALAARLRETGVAAHAQRVDVADSRAVHAAAVEAEGVLGGVDLLVNVAGGNAATRPSLLGDIPGADWDAVVALNLSSAFHCMHACLAPMRRRGGGAVVTVASLASIRMSMNLGVSYTAAKAGLLGLTRHAAVDLAPDRIRVNAVLPGPVMTELMRVHASKSALIDTVPAQLPIGRWVEPEDVANAILFFCSTVSSACTGTHLVVDGGLHIGNPAPAEIYFGQRRRPDDTTTGERAR